MTHPVVFIHGFKGGTHEYQQIIKYLNIYGDAVCYEFSYNEKFGQVSLKNIAEKLHEFILANCVESEIDIVALSQGGVIARYYIGKYHDRKIRKCITICTPHHGSLLAYLGIFPGIKELQPRSLFLKELDTNHAEYYAVYNPLDLMVFPGWSGIFARAKENKRVVSLFHPLTFSHPETLAFIRTALSY